MTFAGDAPVSNALTSQNKSGIQSSSFPSTT